VFVSIKENDAPARRSAIEGRAGVWALGGIFSLT
jgi:hypothetical protein